MVRLAEREIAPTRVENKEPQRGFPRRSGWHGQHEPQIIVGKHGSALARADQFEECRQLRPTSSALAQKDR